MFADKTSNIYEMPLEEYKKLLKENITSPGPGYITGPGYICSEDWVV